MKHTSESLGMSFGYLSPNEIKYLKTLSNSFKEPPVIVNIGAGAGTSGLSFMESRKDKFLYTIDITDKSNPFGCLEAERIQFKNAGFCLDEHNHQIHKDSVTVGKNWKDYYVDGSHKKIDLVFIDGEHSYEGCIGDFESWLPNVKKNGIISIHDYNKKEAFKDKFVKGQPHPVALLGVDKAVSELLSNSDIELIGTSDSIIAFRVK